MKGGPVSVVAGGVYLVHDIAQKTLCYTSSLFSVSPKSGLDLSIVCSTMDGSSRELSL